MRNTPAIQAGFSGLDVSTIAAASGNVKQFAATSQGPNLDPTSYRIDDRVSVYLSLFPAEPSHLHSEDSAVNVWGTTRRFCDGVPRRCLLKAGTVATAGLALTDMLHLKAAGAVRENAPCKSVIMIFLAGGPSHFETFDPKPLAPAEIRGPYGVINTKLPGVQFCETMPGFAKIADQFSVIRSCAHTNPGHGGGQRWMTTGHPPAGLEDELPHDYPQIGSVVAKMKTGRPVDMPAFVRIPPGSGRNDAAYLGPAFSAFHVYSTGKPRGIDLENFVSLERIEDRRALRKAFDLLQTKIEQSSAVTAMDALEQQAFDILSGKTARDAFELQREPRTLRERYGDHEAGKSLLLARRLVEAGVSFASVRIGNWDHHGNAGGTIQSGAQENIPPIDQAVPALLADLRERGLDKEVLVMMWGEFGRTPRINQFVGRDHWPQAMSIMMAGGGVQPGRIIGATNAKGEHPQDNALTPSDVLATVYHQLGLDHRHEFLNSAGRPIPVLPGGEPIRALL